jgi:hypothetical protein
MFWYCSGVSLQHFEPPADLRAAKSAGAELLKPKPGTSHNHHWATFTDEDLANVDLEIESPDLLPGVVMEVPQDHENAYIEFTYDLRGSGREEEFSCVHGHHRHLHGAVMRVDDVRFLVGWICAGTIYGESLAGRIADFDAAKTRRNAVVRIRQLREAVADFSIWADDVSRSGALEAYDDVRNRLRWDFPFIFDTLNAFPGRRIANATMPPNLCADGAEFLGNSFERLMNKVASVTISLTGDIQKAASKIGTIHADIESILRHAEVILRKLSDVELFFHPSTLSALCDYANNAVPRRANHTSGLLKLMCRGQVLTMPGGFSMPSRSAIDRLQAALSG